MHDGSFCSLHISSLVELNTGWWRILFYVFINQKDGGASWWRSLFFVLEFTRKLVELDADRCRSFTIWFIRILVELDAGRWRLFTLWLIRSLVGVDAGG